MAEVETVEGTSPDEVQLRFRSDEMADHAMVTVDAFAAQTQASAVRFEPGDDIRAVLPHLERLRLVEVNFPAFTDGRGYSAARILREAGFQGEIRAVGEVLVDQLFFMRRCGFDSFAPDRPLDPDEVSAALERWPQVYQRAADERVPIFALRHQDGR